MILKDLITNNSFEHVWRVFNEIYPDYSQYKSEYNSVYNELLGMVPIKNSDDMTINIELIDKDPDYVEYYVYGKDVIGFGNGFEPIDTWSLSYSEWERWLGCYIDENILGEYSQCMIIALCLWDMTSHGFNQQLIEQRMWNLNPNFDDVEKWYDCEESIINGMIIINDEFIENISEEYNKTESANIVDLVTRLLKLGYLTTDNIRKIRQSFNNHEVKRKALASLIRFKIDSKELLDKTDIKLLMENRLFNTIDYALDENVISDEALVLFRTPNKGESFENIKEKLFMKVQKLRKDKRLYLK